jgi:hypothetical protein
MADGFLEVKKIGESSSKFAMKRPWNSSKKETP